MKYFKFQKERRETQIKFNKITKNDFNEFKNKTFTSLKQSFRISELNQYD